jgi:hypothetical protein
VLSAIGSSDGIEAKKLSGEFLVSRKKILPPSEVDFKGIISRDYSTASLN